MAGLFGYRPSANIRRALTQIPEVRRQTRRVAATVRDQSRPRLLHDTGASARSMRVVSVFVNGTNEYHVSWDRVHWYAGLHGHNLEIMRAVAARLNRGV